MTRLVILSSFVFAAMGFASSDPRGESALDSLFRLGHPGNFAASDLQNRSSNPFDDISRLFDSNATEAAVPSQSELSQWWAGRCYSNTDKNRSLPSVMFVKQTEDGGPLFPGLGTSQLYVKVSTDDDATKHDTMTASQKHGIEQDFASRKADLTRVKTSDKSLSNLYMGSTARLLIQSVRKVTREGNTYYVSKLAVGIDQASGGTQYHEGDTWWACYHFAKVEFN